MFLKEMPLFLWLYFVFCRQNMNSVHKSTVGKKGKETGMEESEKRIAPERIVFGKSFMTAMAPQGEQYRIFYKDVVWAYIGVPDDETGSCIKPDIVDITDGTEGELVVWDKKRCRWIFRTDQGGETAGSLLKKLCMNAPYIVAGGQDWFDISDKAEFDMIREMVKVKRACCR